MNAKLTTVASLAIAASVACGHDAPAPATTVDAAAGNSGRTATTTHVRLDTSQLAQVRIEELSTKPIDDAIEATGTIEFDADRMARIIAPVSGQVQNLAANVGDTVGANQVLFVLNSREVASALTDHLGSQKDRDLAQKTYEMTADLFEHQAASKIALEQAASELAKANGRVQQSEEVLQVLGIDPHAVTDASRPPSRIPVRSPIAGTIIERNVTTGQFVGPDNPPLVVIADLRDVWVQADVFERDVRNIQVGQRADVTTTAYPDAHFIARVSRIGTVVDPQTRTAKVRVQVDNHDFRLKPGMFTTVSLSLPGSSSSLTAPAKAVFVEDGKSYAYVQTTNGEFVRRQVTTQPAGINRVRVLSGLSAGEHVIADGVLLLRQVEAESAAQ